MATVQNETTAQLAAAANFTGPWRDVGAAPDEARTFGAQVNTDQSGTLYIDGSSDQSTARQCGSVATDGTKPYDLDVPIRFRYYRVRYVNGATQTGAGNFAINSSFRA